MSLSAVDCVQPAIQHTRQQLFAKFRFPQWSRLALVGILAGELHVGGCGFGNSGQLASQRPRRVPGVCRRAPFPFPHLDPARIAQFAGLIAAIVIFAIVFSIVFLYINSVFRFILFRVGPASRMFHQHWMAALAPRRTPLFPVATGVDVFHLDLHGRSHRHSLTAFRSLRMDKEFQSSHRRSRGRCDPANRSRTNLCSDSGRHSNAGQGFPCPDHGSRRSRFRGRLEPSDRPSARGAWQICRLSSAQNRSGDCRRNPIHDRRSHSSTRSNYSQRSGRDRRSGGGSHLERSDRESSRYLRISRAICSVLSRSGRLRACDCLLPAYAMYFFSARYPNLGALLNPTPAPPAPEASPLPNAPPPTPPPLPPSPEPIG